MITTTEKTPAKVQRIRYRKQPEWLPPLLRDMPEVNIRFRFWPSERRVLRKRKEIKPSKWAEKYRVMARGPLAGSKWDNDFMPLLAGMMDAAMWPSVRETVDCKAPQTGGSSMLETMIGYVSDMAPGDTLIVYPDRDTSRENMTERIQPMIKASPRINNLWSGSPTSLGNRSVMYLFLDEVDKYPDTPDKREAGTISLAMKRATAFPHDRKIFKMSTPTVEAGHIWKAFNEAQVRFDAEARCPACGEYQVMKFGDADTPGGIKWPKDERNPTIIETAKLAWYECIHCGDKWNDYRRDVAVRNGRWVARDDGRELFQYLREVNPKKIAFHRPSWYSPLVSMSDAVAAFLRDLKDFMNNHKAEPWYDYAIERDEDKILALRDARPRGIVPSEADVLGIVIDTQQDGFYYEVRAAEFGMNQETWQVREGYVETFSALEEIIYHSEYRNASGMEYHIAGGFIDSGGGTAAGKKHSRTAEVYDWCHKNPKIKPIKGFHTQATPWRAKRLDHFPDTGRPIPGGLMLYTLDVNHYKDLLAAKLSIEPSDPGAWHLHKDADFDYARQYCAEYMDDRGHWQCASGKANHYWDCGVYFLAWADMKRIKFRRRPSQDDSTAKPEKPRRTGFVKNF